MINTKKDYQWHPLRGGEKSALLGGGEEKEYSHLQTESGTVFVFIPEECDFPQGKPTTA